MKNNDFLAMCKNIDPSGVVDRASNLASIKSRIKDEEQIIMRKKSLKKPFVLVAALVAVMAFSLAAYAAVPAIYRWVVDINRFDVYNIVDDDISFRMGFTPYGEPEAAADFNVSFEEASLIAAREILARYDFNVSGLEGYMHFIDNSANGYVFWSGFIISYEHTLHSEATELFHFTICAITGDIFWLAMNTPESPFR